MITWVFDQRFSHAGRKKTPSLSNPYTKKYGNTNYWYSGWRSPKRFGINDIYILKNDVIFVNT